MTGSRSFLLCAGVLALLIGLAGCSRATPVPTARPEPTETATPVPTSTPSPTVRPSPSPTAGCQAEEGELKHRSYHSPLLAKEVEVWVYQPPCYPWAGERLPAAFFFHGKPYSQSHWPDLGLIDTYQAGLAQGRWQRGLLFMPRLPEPLFSSSDGGPNSYEQEFLEGLMPYAEEEYRLLPEGEGRRLAGISRGGIWALEIGLRHPERFDRLAALSPSLAVNYPRPAYDPFRLVETQPRYPDRLLLLAGEEDWAKPKTEQLAMALQQAGAEVQLEIVSGDHLDPTWRRSLPVVLDFLFPNQPR